MLMRELMRNKRMRSTRIKKTRAGTELTGSIPITTPGACSARAAVTQLARATVEPGLVLMLRARGGGARIIGELAADLGGGGGRALFFNGQFQFCAQCLHKCNKHQVDGEQRSQGLRQALQGSGGCSPWEQQ